MNSRKNLVPNETSLYSLLQKRAKNKTKISNRKSLSQFSLNTQKELQQLQKALINVSLRKSSNTTNENKIKEKRNKKLDKQRISMHQKQYNNRYDNSK